MPINITPEFVQQLLDQIAALVEQNAKKALGIANRAYVLETGNIVLDGDAKELMNNETVKKAYLGE